MKPQSFYELIAQQIRTDQLDKLDLFDSKLGGERICELVKELKGNKSVKEVFLSYCKLGPSFADVLCDVLKVNTSLTKLNLVGNNLGDQGARVIAEALKGNQCVTELFFGSNNLGSAGAQAIGGMMRVNKTLKWLTLSNNNFGPEGAQAVAEALKVNKSIEELWLSHNGIGTEGTPAIGEALKVNCNLKELYLDGNFGAYGARALLDALQVNGSLTYCRVDVFESEFSALCERNKAIHKRAAETVVCLLALRRMRRVAVFPKEMMLMIGQMLWITRSDIDAWSERKVKRMKCE